MDEQTAQLPRARSDWCLVQRYRGVFTAHAYKTDTSDPRAGCSGVVTDRSTGCLIRAAATASVPSGLIPTNPAVTALDPKGELEPVGHMGCRDAVADLHVPDDTFGLTEHASPEHPISCVDNRRGLLP